MAIVTTKPGTCEACSGIGRKPSACLTCHSGGRVVEGTTFPYACPDCDNWRCRQCGGTGYKVVPVDGEEA